MTEPTPVRKLPVTVEAMHYEDHGNVRSVIGWVLDNGGNARAHYAIDGDHRGDHLAIDTLEGPMRAMPGDWIIRGVKGEFYPCKPDVFAETYEAVEAESGVDRRRRADVEARFFTASGGQPPTDEQKAAVAELRELIVALGVAVVKHVPRNRQRELALEALEDVQMRANRGIFSSQTRVAEGARGECAPHVTILNSSGRAVDFAEATEARIDQLGGAER